MGWCSGSQLAEDIWNEIRPKLTPEQIKDFSKVIYSKFCDFDADDWEFCEKSLEYDYMEQNKPQEFLDRILDCE